VGKLVTILLVGALACSAAGAALARVATAPDARIDGYAAFHTPSGNIGCVYLRVSGSARGDLRCDIRTGIRPRPRKPASCELDYGSGYSMADTGRAHVVCAGDTVLHQGGVLRYGAIWRRGGFTCISGSAGLRCANRSRHGFFLSRAHSYVV
jgi:hypothetical protein